MTARFHPETGTGDAADTATRMMCVYICDWPVVAAGVPPDLEVAVFFANRAVAVSAPARARGVAVGQRRREAQRRCPTLEVLERDLPAEARVFDAVLSVVESFTPRLEVDLPGVCGFPTRGPSRYFGGDATLARRVRDAVTEHLDGSGRAQVGAADGRFAATLAARSIDAAVDPVVVPPGGSRDFLEGFGARALERPELVDVLERLGLRTLGAVAELSVADLLGRFGPEGERAHRLASGLDEYPPRLLVPPPDLRVEAELDPPAERVEQVAVVGRALAEELHGRLGPLGLSCVRVGIRAESEHGEIQERFWRHEGTLTAPAMADRVRWQLDGWLTGPSRFRPTSGITGLGLIPDEVVPAAGRQLGFWGGETESAERAARALARVASLLGPDAVVVPEGRGGRHPRDEFRLVPAGAVDLANPPEGGRTGTTPPVDVDWADLTGPVAEVPVWPGRLPRPRPAAVHPEPAPVEVVDASGVAVTVDARLETSGDPVRLSVDGGPWVDLAAWAGPWPVDERWWDPGQRRRQARFQVLIDSGVAHVLTLEGGRWWLDATYD